MIKINDTVIKYYLKRYLNFIIFLFFFQIVKMDNVKGG